MGFEPANIRLGSRVKSINRRRHSPGHHEGDAELRPQGGEGLVDLPGQVRQFRVPVFEPGTGDDLPEDV